MAITVTKTELKPKTGTAKIKLTNAVAEAAETVSTPVEKLTESELVDLYGQLDEQVKQLMKNPIVAQHTELKAELQKRLEAKPQDTPVKLRGEHWGIEASACGKAPRKIANMGVLGSLLGTETFLKVVKCSIGDAEKYLTKEQLAKVVGPDTLTNNRTLKVIFYG